MTPYLISPAFLSRFPRRVFFQVLTLLLIVFPARAEDKKEVTEPLGTLSEPLALSLDFPSFNPPEGKRTDQKLGEVLSLFDEFLEAQSVSATSPPGKLERLESLIRRDYQLARQREKSLADEYEAMKNELERLQSQLAERKNSSESDRYRRLKEESQAIKKRRNILRTYIEFEGPLLKKIETAGNAAEGSMLREEAYEFGVRILYTLFADQYLTEVGNDPSNLSLREILQITHEFTGRAALNATPFYSPKTRNDPVGSRGSLKEAANLIDPSHPGSFVPASRLALMSHEEISRLDVSPENPMWHTHHMMESGKVDTWRQLERWIESRVSEELSGSKKFRNEFPAFRYDLQSSRKILFWDEIKTTATSPKIDTLDAFGQKWKLKWGEEAAVEPVAHRLRLSLGAKFADLNYIDVGGLSHLLILPSETERTMNPDREMPLTLHEFKETMMNSKYEFNVKPFILSSGVITAANADSILADLPAGASGPFRKNLLIGRTWIRFRESMVEANHDVVTRGGPVSTHCAATAGDRAIRQSMIVAFWMGHTDMKEDNFRSVWIEGFDGKKSPQYLEFFHDPGSAFGAGKRSGELNRFNYDYGNGGFLWLAPDEHTLYSNYFCLYRPGHFHRVTFADQLSGARHIARLTKEDIARAVDASMMPDFYRACLAWRLIKRRDLIARVYGIPPGDAEAGEAPEYIVPLTTREDRAAAARHYLIPLEEIENDLVTTGHLAPANRAGPTKRPFNDVIVKGGVISSYSDSVIPGILRDFRHPTGFVKRMTRYDDNAEWKSKRFGSK
jgi:hypothetical protein